MRRLLSLSILGLLLIGGPAAWAEDDTELRLSKDGFRVKLEDGLIRAPLSGLQITRRDLESGLGVDVRQLIPRPTAKSRRRKPQPRTWTLCYGRTCATYRGEVGGTDGHETFLLEKVAKLFRWKLHSNETHVEISDGGTPKTRFGGKPGARVTQLALPDLDGTSHSLTALRGKRVLIVVWAPWSASRDTLARWTTEWKLRKERNLELWLVGVDIEGAERVRSYIPPGFESNARVDRDGRILQMLGGSSVGRFVLVDDLGVVRAAGTTPSSDDLTWIDQHLEEKGREASVDERRVPPRPDISIAQTLVERKPNSAGARVELASAFERLGDLDSALTQMTKAVELSKRPRGLAIRLARMHLDKGDRPSAMKVLDDARRKDPGFKWLRTQYWALEAPERFYSGPIDTAWQTAQRKAEDLEWGRRRKR